MPYAILAGFANAPTESALSDCNSLTRDRSYFHQHNHLASALR